MDPLGHPARLRDIGRNDLEPGLKKYVVLVGIYEFGQRAVESIRRNANRVRPEDCRNIIEFVPARINDVGLLRAELSERFPDSFVVVSDTSMDDNFALGTRARHITDEIKVEALIDRRQNEEIADVTIFVMDALEVGRIVEMPCIGKQTKALPR